MSLQQAASALNRFGLGAKPGQLRALGEPREWLLSQLTARSASSPDVFSALPSSRDYLQREFAYNRERLAERRAQRNGPLRGDAKKPGADGDAIEKFKTSFRKTFGQDMLAEIGARYRLAAIAEAGFAERLAHFWSNHFAVSVDKRQASLYAAPMEREAIRPHVFGRFEDLLLAAETHPGMLRYLDNAQSVGESSMFAARGARRLRRGSGDGMPPRKLGLNENLAREILELHTLGVNAGYTQADVTELARAITGWGTPLARDFDAEQGVDAAFAFRAAAHEPGARTVLGKRYAEGGVEQGRAVLTDLARHPATARQLSLKLARHFVADDPPKALVERMTAAYLRNGGDLRDVYRAMIESDLAWAADARKFKTPDDFLVSALRAGGIDAGARPEGVVALLRQLGQPPFTPRSPAGFADTAADWTGPDALWKRVQAAQALAQRVPPQRLQPLQVAQDTLGSALDADTRTALARAETVRDGVALLFASPAFQWRT
ncbi:DUF1800 domain-containing protein [Luteimonas sp. SX5]|uniref:DUF1800 domain-containing protein n=1 Tax=Luteimonas galliterrae TaxID=2940486 RepID=A0ABT0MFN9_9GAMM|nr:DUF1800 domain-containing protein [Luteimonas galliterrae]MCL1633145.1 DUF1800 domain-containing protein [Luteimonas galliterrae]